MPTIGESGAGASRSLFRAERAAVHAEGDSGEPAPVFVVYGFKDALAALTAAADLGRKIRLRCPFAVTASLGPQVAKSMIEQAFAAVPQAIATWSLDCGDEAGTALAALRVGVPEVQVSLPVEVRARVGDIGRQLGARVSEDLKGTPVLDLANADDPIAACRKWLAGLGLRPGSAPNRALPRLHGSCI